jgi:hypothetical protein
MLLAERNRKLNFFFLVVGGWLELWTLHLLDRCSTI